MIGTLRGSLDGEAPIVDVGADEGNPCFGADMRPNEVMKLILGSLGRTGAVNAEGVGLCPAGFGSTKEFRFELTLQTAEDRMKRGMAMGAIEEEKLQLIAYLAADMSHYDTDLEEAARVFASVETIWGANPPSP